MPIQSALTGPVDLSSHRKSLSCTFSAASMQLACFYLAPSPGSRDRPHSLGQNVSSLDLPRSGNDPS